MAWRSVPKRPNWWQHQQQQQRDQNKWTEACDSQKLQVPGLSCTWWGFKAWDTFKDSTDNSSIDKVETHLERHKHSSPFQDKTDALPWHIRFPVCL